MPVINAAALPTGNPKGAEYGATISLILDHSDTPHKFTSRGPGRPHVVCIHANPTFETEWLE